MAHRYDALEEFEVLNYMAGGSFGEVYNVLHKGSREICTIKETLVHVNDDKEVVDLYMSESKLLSQISFPYIIGASFCLPTEWATERVRGREK